MSLVKIWVIRLCKTPCKFPLCCSTCWFN